MSYFTWFGESWKKNLKVVEKLTSTYPKVYSRCGSAVEATGTEGSCYKQQPLQIQTSRAIVMQILDASFCHTLESKKCFFTGFLQRWTEY